MIGLTLNLTLTLLLVERGLDICLEVKFFHLAMVHQCLVFTQNTSTWRAPKTNSAELETFLSTVEKELFIKIKRNYVKCNLTKDERRSLTP